MRRVLVAIVALGACAPAALRLVSDGGTSPPDGGAPSTCAGPTDCPVGQACDVNSGTCSTNCDGQTVCNGGCCDGTRCQPGDAPLFCGSQGGACTACAADTPSCVNGQCVGSCSPGTVCGAGFCCGADGGCVAGSNSATCGSGGACVNCAMSTTMGHACVDAGCTCLSAADCPKDMACDTATGKCSTTCLSGTKSGCNGGCCDRDSSTCQSGGWHYDCGNDGGF